ncbi:MAG TPA: peptidylprolyl isomerase, partial [Isosphaeraceae bacterium]|nr:peptidylprolyl isomerase [Isosphaeraceae bacterium]
MFESRPTDASRSGADRRVPRRTRRPAIEPLEDRQLLATLASIPSPLAVPAGLGYQLPLTGGSDNQTYSATSSNPDVQVSPATGHFWTVSVSHTAADSSDVSFSGSMTFQLFGDLTPDTVQKIEQLITSGYYTSPTQPTDGSTALASKNFHRIISGFAAQAGSLTGNGSGSLTAPGYPFSDQFNQQLVFNGNAQLAMANAGNDTNDSQFFITYGPQRSLDFNYTIFGQLVSGLDTLNELSQVEVTTTSSGEKSQPKSPVLITASTLSDVNPNGVLHIDTTNAQAGETSTVTVTAHDPSNGTATTQSFQVNVTANVDSSGNVINEPAFLNPVNNLTIATGQTAQFALPGVNPDPTRTLSYVVAGGTSTDSSGKTTFSSVQNATASVDSNGIVKLTPKSGFTGVINLLVGVTNKPGDTSSSPGSPSDYDTQKMTVTVQNGQVVKLPP